MLRNRLYYILLVILLGIFYVYSNSYFALLFLLIVVIMPLLSLIALLGIYRKLSFEAEVSEAGNQAPHIIFTVINKSLIPVTAFAWEVELCHYLSGKCKTQGLSCILAPKSRNTMNLAVKNGKTGKLIIRTKNIKANDFLGLFSLSVAAPAASEVLIYPQLFGVHVQTDRKIEVYGDSLNYSQNRAGNDVNEVFALHEYAEGDDLRKVHWKLSSKTDELMVREFGLPLNHPIAILLELKKSGRSDDDTRLSACVDTFVSLSVSLLQAGVGHYLSWLDREGFLHFQEVAELDELQVHIPSVLECTACGEDESALEYYEQSQLSEVPVLYYVTSSCDSPVLAEIANKQMLRVLIIGGEQSAPVYLPPQVQVVTVPSEDTAGIELVI